MEKNPVVSSTEENLEKIADIHTPPAVSGQGPPGAGFAVFSQTPSDVWDMEPESDGFRKSGGWSVSWADLMMTMFVLFTVLYVYQAGNRNLRLGQGPGGSELGDNGGGQVVNMTLENSPSDLYDRTRQAVMDEFTSGTVSVDMVEDKAVRITIAGDILFDPGRALLKPSARERLMQIAAVIQTSSYAVNVVGHTDSMPNHSEQYPTNWELSAARAVGTARFLIENAGVDPKRVYISAHAWHQPVRSNATRADRRLNRRVEIILEKPRL